MICARCETELVSIKGCAFEISGWDEDRAAGGTNHVLFRKRTGRVLCMRCKHDLQDGKPWEAHVQLEIM